MDYYANKQNSNVGPRAGEIRHASKKSQSVVKLGSWIQVVRVSLICRMQGGSFREVLSVRCSRLSAPREERPGERLKHRSRGLYSKWQNPTNKPGIEVDRTHR